MTDHVAGRELDALVAEKVMGWKVDNEHPYTTYYDGIDFMGSNCEDDQAYWSPSTDIAAAWQVVEKMRERGYDTCVSNGERPPPNVWEAEIYVYPGGLGGGCEKADTAPLAICLAALKACG